MTRNLRLGDLPRNAPTPFDLAPDAAARTLLARELRVDAVRKARLVGTLTPVGRRDWNLTADLGATVVQPCVATLVPVTTRIDEPVARRYRADLPRPEPGEVEVPDEDVEDLPETLDLGALLAEALALALPLYPRAPDADTAGAARIQVTEPGKTPMSDEDARPFAGLAHLRDRLTGGESSDD